MESPSYLVENIKLFLKHRGAQLMVRKYTLKTIISIIVVFKFYYCYLTHPLELVIDSLGKHFPISEEKLAF